MIKSELLLHWIIPSLLEDKYEDIDLDSINILINGIYNETNKLDNIVDVGNDKKIYFKDLINFS